MRARQLLIAVALLLLAAPASAHRLDEYLQATTIAVEKDHVTLRLHLIPGVDVARSVLAAIDTDGDGIISEPEQQAYAGRVVGDLSLAINGSGAPLRLISSSFPAEESIRKGVGEIILAFDADIAPGSSNYMLSLANRHRSDIAVYLMNCLLPSDPAIRIVAQDRSYDQSSYRLDFAVRQAAATRDLAGGADTQSRFAWQDAVSVVETFFWQGVRHILTGYDHLLFVAALVLGAATLWDLIKVVTAFTVAHSITLTLAALNLAHVPGGVVEPLIAASIVFVALQNIIAPDRSRGWSRLAVAFFFGLFHGLGFAGGLLDVMHQMPRETILLAILGFSIGIEAGNQVVLLPLFGLLKAAHSAQRDAARRLNVSTALQRVGSAVVSVAGTYYLGVALAGSV